MDGITSACFSVLKACWCVASHLNWTFLPVSSVRGSPVCAKFGTMQR